MLRKLSLSGLLQFVERGTATQVLVGCCIAFCSFGVHVRLLPYREPEANVLKVCAEVVLFLTFLISFILRVLPRIEMYEPVNAQSYGYVLLGAFLSFAALFVGLVARQAYRRRRFQGGLTAFAGGAFDGERHGEEGHELGLLTRGTSAPGGAGGAGVGVGTAPVDVSGFTAGGSEGLDEPLVGAREGDGEGGGESAEEGVPRSPMNRLYMWVASQ